MRKIILGCLLIGLVQLFAIEFTSSNLNNFVQNMDKYQNQDIKISFDTQEKMILTTQSNNGYYAIEELAGFTRYIELDNSNFIISENLITNKLLNIKGLTCTVYKSNNNSKFHFHKYVCDIKKLKIIK